MKYFNYSLVTIYILLFFCSPTHLFSLISKDDPNVKEWIKNRKLIKAEEAEGKKIRKLTIKRREIFNEEDIYPDFLNYFHAITKEEIIWDDLQLKEGDYFSKYRLDESMRNLFDSSIFSEVVYFIVEVNDTYVDVLIVTKDIWSLKLSNKPTGGGGQFSLESSLNENNLFGYNKNIAIETGIDTFEDAINVEEGESPKLKFDYYIGESYYDRRFLGTKHIFLETARFFYHEGKKTGDLYLLQIIYPLHRRDTKWGYGVDSTYYNRIFRKLGEGGVLAYPSTYDIENINDTDNIPTAPVYRHRQVNGGAYIVRSIGYYHKLNIYFGSRFYKDHYGTVPNIIGDMGDKENKTNWYLYNTLNYFYDYNYKKLTNFNNFGYWEYVPEGYSISLTTSYFDEYLGAADTKLVFSFYALYQKFYLGDNMFRASLIQDYTVVNGILGKGDGRRTNITLRNYTTEFWIGRFISQVDYAQSLPNYTNSKLVYTSFGGSIEVFPETNSYYFFDRTHTILRGYPSNFIYAQRSLMFNFEYRTKPVYVLSTYLGGVLFADMLGFDNETDAYSLYPKTNNLFDFYSAVGFGFRMIFPQFNRMVMRLDVGFPLRYSNLWQYREKQISFGFFQIF